MRPNASIPPPADRDHSPIMIPSPHMPAVSCDKKKSSNPFINIVKGMILQRVPSRAKERLGQVLSRLEIKSLGWNSEEQKAKLEVVLNNGIQGKLSIKLRKG